MYVFGRVDLNEVESLSCTSCHVSFADVDQLVEHSARPCGGSSEADADGCSAEVGDDVDGHGTVGASTSGGALAADADAHPGTTSGNVDDVDDELDAALDAASDDVTQPRLALSNTRPSPPSCYRADDDHDDGRLDISPAAEYMFRNVSTSGRSGGVQYGPEVMDAPTAVARRFPVADGGHENDDGGRSPKRSGSTSKTNVSQLIDNNVSPASKIAMLESVVYALHQQQMFQLELIEALRRQLATALAASSSSSCSAASALRPGDVDVNGATTLDLTVPRASTNSSVVDRGSSLSSLMRLSAGVDARQAPPADVRSPSTSPTTLSGSASDGHDAAGMTTCSWQPALQAIIQSRPLATAPVPTSLLSTPKHGPPLSDLNVFKKGERRTVLQTKVVP